jgi:hypothetical protein
VCRDSFNAETGELLQHLPNPQKASMEELFMKLPSGVKVIHTIFKYRRGGQPWHRHVQLVSGRAKACQEYPPELVLTILRGCKAQLQAEGLLCSLEVGPTNQTPEVDWEESFPEVFDTVSGKALDPVLITEARNLEIEYIRRYGVYKKVLYETSFQRVGKKPIKSKWVDINKGDDGRPDYRSRRVAMEIKRSWQSTAFAGTPPLEALRFLLSLATTRSETNTVEKPYRMSFIDIRRAHFTAAAQRELYVEIPEEDQDDPQGRRLCGLLLKSMYGTQDAAQNWENEHTDFLTSEGFVAGLGSACLFYHPVRDIRIDVHGDDFTNLGHAENLEWLRTRFLTRYEIKDQGIFGPGENEVKEVRILNRIITWDEAGITYEADPRHADLIIQACGPLPTRAINTPGILVKPEAEGEAIPLGAADAFSYRSVAMRAQYLSLDRPEIQFATKELARHLTVPTAAHWKAVERLARFLVHFPRVVWRFPYQNWIGSFVQYTDSDDAGCLTTRASTSAGALMHGGHLIKTYSNTQKTLSLSSGESEFYGTIKAASSGIGAISMAADLGCQVSCALATDASASMSLVSRTGHGKTKHIHINFLWIQQRIKEGIISVVKVGTADNVSDIGTKHLEYPRIIHLLNLCNLEFRTDRIAFGFQV